VPVTLTFLVIPSEQGKDLDNIALIVLPIAHEVLRPHIAPHLLSPIYGGGGQDPWLDEALARLKSVNARSVRVYQVIELPRTPQDPPEGTLRLALGPHTHWSWWHRAGTYVSSAIDRAEQCVMLDDRFTGWYQHRPEGHNQLGTDAREPPFCWAAPFAVNVGRSSTVADICDLAYWLRADQANLAPSVPPEMTAHACRDECRVRRLAHRLPTLLARWLTFASSTGDCILECPILRPHAG
jgi:hypothetical protein